MDAVERTVSELTAASLEHPDGALAGAWRPRNYRWLVIRDGENGVVWFAGS